MILCQLLMIEVKSQGMAKQEFFEKSEISQATWSRINRGQSQLTFEDLRRAANVLSMPLTDLIEKAEKIATALPKEDVEVVDIPKKPRGASAKKSKKDNTVGEVVSTVIVVGALAFLISKIMRS
ncbi:MAG: hypothetical protein COB46_06965 [Rhodospirillaceae bacterium]|nr:MAG: hypothetical protein COB46_06965 [Rhodospirillaceae bacterium]